MYLPIQVVFTGGERLVASGDSARVTTRLFFYNLTHGFWAFVQNFVTCMFVLKRPVLFNFFIFFSVYLLNFSKKDVY